MTERPQPVSGRRSWVGAGLVVVAVLTGVSTLGTLLRPGPWLGVSAVVVTGLAALIAAARTGARSPGVPSLWGLGGAALVVAVLYTGIGSRPSLPVPDEASLARLTGLVSEGVATIADGRVPLAPTRGVELLVVLGAVCVLLLTDLLALGMGRAGLAGVPLAMLWAVPALFVQRPPAWALLLGGCSFLLLLALTRPPRRGTARSSPRDVWPAIGAAALVTVLTVALTPLAVGIPGYGTALLPGSWGAVPGDRPTRVSIDLDMRASLASRSDRPLFTYSTTTSAVGPLRMYTMAVFDGRQWQREQGSAELEPVSGPLWPAQDPQPVGEDADVELLSIRVGNLDQGNLPIPLHPREVDVSDGWSYDGIRDEVVGAGVTTRGLAYQVRFTLRDLSAAFLRAQSPGDRFGEESAYLEVPQTPFADEIRALAADVASGAGTTYDQALALQSYLRDAAQFTYDPEVPPARTDDAVWDFLTERRGYCVQYATAMTVMARTLDIPARIAVGFLPGSASVAIPSQFEVTGRQSHAWPELYFADAGWVRFEPTPATQTGSPPPYADPLAGTPVTSPDVPTGTAAPSAPTSPTPTPSSAPVTAGDGQVGIGQASVPLLVVVVVGTAIVVGLGIAGAWLLARRSRGAGTSVPGPEQAWAELRRRLALAGVTWSDATTPRQAARAVEARYGTEDVAAQAALRRLVALVERERYSPLAPTWTAEDLDTWVDEAAGPLTQAEVASGADAERR